MSGLTVLCPVDFSEPSRAALVYEMGSVTYRALALTRTLVLAVPPTLDAAPA